MSRRVGRNAYTGLFNDVVLLAACVVVGGIFVAHGWQKYDQGFAGTEQFLGGLGVPEPAIAAQVATYVELAGGRFRPHLTVARTGTPVELSNWVRLLDAYRGPTWTVSSFALVRSRLGEGPRKRPAYQVIAEFPFG